MRQPTAGTDVARIASDPESLEAFYRQHVDAIARFVARRVRDPYLVADLTADVFVAAIESAHTYRRRRGEPIAWLYGVARNVVAAERRRGVRARHASLEIPAGSTMVDGEDVARLHERIDAEAQSRRLYEAIDQLPDGERAVLELVAIEGLAVGEAARALGIRPVAARVRLHRARRALRDDLDPAFAEISGQLTEASS